MSVDRSRLPVPGPDPEMRFPRIRTHEAAGRLRVRTVEHRDVPVLALLLLVPGGAAADPQERAGLAALTADLLDEGAAGRTAFEIHDALARLGAQLDTEVGADASLVTIVTLARHRDTALRLLAEIAFRPTLGDADFERIRELRRNRLAQMRDVPSAMAERAFLEHLYGAHPYGHLAIGTERSLGAVSLDDVLGFHRAQYRLERATLVAVGDASHEELLEAVAREFVPMAAGGAPGEPAGIPRVVGAPLLQARGARRIVLIDRPDAPQSEIRVGRLGPARDTDDYFPLIVLNTVLGGQFVSRINLKLREEKGFTYGARSGFDFRRGPGPFLVQASVQSDATAEALEDVLRELDDIRGARPANAAELTLARAALTRGYPRSFETAEQIARGVVQLELYGLPDDYFDRFVARVNDVPADAVTRVARQWLDTADALTVVVGDAARVQEQLGARALGELVRV